MVLRDFLKAVSRPPVTRIGTLLALAFGLSLRGADPVLGIDVPWVVTTGGLPPLSTLELPLTTAVTGLPDHLTFELGFATREIPMPGGLFDSFTLTIAGPAPSEILTLLTADAFGLTVAPVTPGGIPLPPGSLTLIPIAPFEPLLPGAVTGLAYRADLVIPDALAGKPLTVRFDVFDNGDSEVSRAYAQVRAVPELSPVWLLGAGLLLMRMLARKSK